MPDHQEHGKHREHRSLVLLTSIWIAFTLLFLNPLQILASDPERLGGLAPLSVIVEMLLATCGLALLLLLPYLLLGRHWARHYLALLCGIGLMTASYSHFISPSFGLFRGQRFVNEDVLFTLAARWQWAEIFFLLALFPVAAALLKRAPNLLIIFFVALSAMGVTNTILSISTMQKEKVEETSTQNHLEQKLTAQGFTALYRFSKTQENIVLIVPDAGASYLLSQIFADSELQKKFEGFTFFKNTVSIGNYTMSSTAALLAGERFSPTEINRLNNKTIKNHIIDAHNWLVETMDRNGIQSTLTKTKWTHCNDLKKVDYCGSGYDDEKKLNQHFAYKPQTLFDRDTLMLMAAFKALPLTLKARLYASKRWKKTFNSRHHLAATTNTRYLRYLTYEALPLKSESSDQYAGRFVLLWNTTLVSPFYLDEKCRPLQRVSEEIYSAKMRLHSTRCVFQSLGRWFDWMRSEGIYDNTKIIIASDHGSEDYNHNWYKGAIKAMMLVKDFQKKGSLQTSEQLMQNSDVAAIICSTLKKPCQPQMKDPIRHPQPNRVARYHVTTHGNETFAKTSKQFAIEKVYEIQGNLYDHPDFR